MTVASDQIAAVAAWLTASSQPYHASLGGFVERGPYGTLVTVGIDDAGADVAALCAQGVLPIYTPQTSPVAVDLSVPLNQDAIAERAYHVAWAAGQAARDPAARFPPVAVVTLATPATTIRQAMTAAGLPIDLAARGVLALPIYALSVAAVERLAGVLPVV
jgi:hypothetical protein